MKKLDLKALIIHEDEDYIIINKPPFLSTLEDRHAYGKANIIQLARDYFSESQVAHRLDRETSGALAIAKNPEAYRNIAIQFEKRRVNKIYHALVDGIHNFEEEVVDKPIHALKTGLVKIDFEKGKEALTKFQTLKVFKKHSLIECRPVSGRMHQIRIHLALLGASIAGDEQYGGKPVYLSEIKKHFNLKKFSEEQPLIQRFALHAFSLQFKNCQEEMIQVEAPYPKDYRALIRQLEKFGQ